MTYALSRALWTKASAAAAIVPEVFDFVAGLDDPGLSGNGGGARSGSELSHLRLPKYGISLIELYETHVLSFVHHSLLEPRTPGQIKKRNKRVHRD